MSCSARSLALFLLFAGASSAANAATARFIVAYEDGLSARMAARAAALEVRLELPERNAVAVEMTPAAARALAEAPGVAYVELDPPRFPLAQTVPTGITLVQAPEIAPGPDPVTVCIIDTGFDLGHEDLPTIDVAGFGTDWDDDACNHGTPVAGIVGALSNRKGVVGVIPGVSLYVVNVFPVCGSVFSSVLVEALYRCRDAGAKVVNMSLGCAGEACRSFTEEAAVDDLYEQGILSVAAAGNDGNALEHYPASYSSVISVAAVDWEKRHASFSQRNPQVELAAPGVDVLSTATRRSGYNVSLRVGRTALEAVPMEGSPNRSGRGPLVECGLGDATCPGNGRHVCLIERGQITFAEKVRACEDGGGRGAVIYNNIPGLVRGTLLSAATSIPSVGITRADGLALLERLGKKARMKTRAPGHYLHVLGTSMASPHVAGVAALLWTHNARWTPDDIRGAMAETAEDLGRRGRDVKFGHGLVRAADALALLLGEDR